MIEVRVGGKVDWEGGILAGLATTDSHACGTVIGREHEGCMCCRQQQAADTGDRRRWQTQATDAGGGHRQQTQAADTGSIHRRQTQAGYIGSRHRQNTLQQTGAL